MIDTRRVAGWRSLRFNSLAEMTAEAERIAAAERAGTLTRLGNWTTGQMFGHVAYWMGRSFEGYPRGFGPPGWITPLLKLSKKRFLTKGMPRGFRIRGVPGGTLATDPMDLEAGLAMLRRAAERLEQQEPRHANAVFGPMGKDEWIRLNLRHAELHFGYFLA